MREYTITPVSGPVDWSGIPVLPIDVQLWGTETDITAQGQLCYTLDPHLGSPKVWPLLAHVGGHA